MGIHLSEYGEIFSRPGRTRQGDDGFELAESDEGSLDRAWSEVGEEDGVVQLPDQPSEEEIRSHGSYP